jgi:hypothetical protein
MLRALQHIEVCAVQVLSLPEWRGDEQGTID